MPPEVRVIDGTVYKRCNSCGEFKNVGTDYSYHKLGFLSTQGFCKECRRIRGRQYYANNWEQDNRRKRDWVLKNQYQLTREEYDEMSKNGCQSCGFKDGRLCVDHDHKTGKVRGVLCTRCNTALGSLQDSEDLILKLAAYIRERISVTA